MPFRKVKIHKGFAHTLGERHPSSKLTEAMVLLIRKERGSLHKIGLKYGVSAAAVGKIKRKQTWQWLRDDGSIDPAYKWK